MPIRNERDCLSAIRHEAPRSRLRGITELQHSELSEIFVGVPMPLHVPFDGLPVHSLPHRRHLVIQQCLAVFHRKHNVVVDVPRTVRHLSGRLARCSSMHQRVPENRIPAASYGESQVHRLFSDLHLLSNFPALFQGFPDGAT